MSAAEPFEQLVQAMTVADRPTDVSPIRVQPLVEQERDGTVRHEVHLDLHGIDWRMLVGDIAARIHYLRSTGHAEVGPLLAAAGVRPCDFEQQGALTKLVALLAGVTHQGSQHTLPPKWVLTPDGAVEMIRDLDAAATPPVVCPCGAVVQQPTQLTTTCGGCVDAIGGNR